MTKIYTSVLYFFCLLSLAFKPGFSQEIEWQKTIGGNNVDWLSSMKQTSDGGYILGGTSVSNFSGNKTENCIGGNDYWIVKTDSIGNIQWQNTIGGILNDNLTSVMQTADGGFILGGYSESYIFGDKTENCLGDFDYWIVKTDSLGNIQWQNTIGGILEDELFALQQTADGGYILGGKSRSDISGDKTENSQGGYDYWIVKTDSIGNIQWQNTIGGSINDELNSIHQTADGGFILGGFSGSGISGDKTINQTDSLNDFAYQPIGTFDDVCVTITPLGQFRSGFTATYQINYGNYGTTTIAPTVYFYPDTNVTFQSATLTPSQITTDSVVWSLPAMLPFQTGSIIITVNVDLGLPIGTLINSRAHIEPYLTDANPSCNNSNWEVYTTGSLDPNDIIVNRSDFTTTELSATHPGSSTSSAFKTPGTIQLSP
jgi:hypothetical protein